MNVEPAPLSYGQLSVWRDCRGLGRERWHEANTKAVWGLGEPGVGDMEHEPAAVERAVRALGHRHESLRTVYDLSDSYAPTQRVLPLEDADAVLDGCVVECRDEADFEQRVEQLAAEPFDLSAAPAWRFRVLTGRGRPVAVAVVKHHIMADGWAEACLQSEFRTALAGGPAASGAAAPPTPRELAAWQRSAGSRPRREVLLAHWERLFDLDAASLRPVGAAPEADTALQCTIRSPRALARAQELAKEHSLPVPGVVLAAFAWTVAHTAGTGPLVVQLMSANRFVPPWSKVVSSTNQWAAASLDPPADFVSYIRHIHAKSLSAYRQGMYDVDEVDALRDKTRAGRDPYEASLGFNYLSVAEVPVDAPAPEDGPTWQAPFSRIGHPCYLRATEEAGRCLDLRLRTLGLTEAVTTQVLEGTLARLIDADG